MTQIVDPYSQLEQDLRPPPSDVPTAPLFHYTNGAGLLGIVKSGRIWATHFRHLNDRQELESGADLVQDVARRLTEDKKIDSASRNLFRDFVVHHERHPTHVWYNPYIASFSEEGNLLSQWRAYADNGAGYSLGLRLTVRYDRPSLLTGSLLRCEYDESVFRSRVRTDFVGVATKLKRHIKLHANTAGDTKRAFVLALQTLAIHTMLLVPRYKASAFREEREWRMVAFPSEEKNDSALTLFRTSPRGLVPYIEIPLMDGEPIPFTRIYVGPTQDAATGVSAVALLLKLQGYEGDALVASSGIPFRT